MEKFYIRNWRFINPKYRGLRLGRRYMTYERMWNNWIWNLSFCGKNSNYGKFKDEITLKFTSKSKEKRSLWSCFIVSTKQFFMSFACLKIT
jgi:hypothetical protein